MAPEAFGTCLYHSDIIYSTKVMYTRFDATVHLDSIAFPAHLRNMDHCPQSHLTKFGFNSQTGIHFIRTPSLRVGNAIGSSNHYIRNIFLE